MERRITDSLLPCAAALWLCLAGPAAAATVRGTVQFPDEVKGGALRHGGYWRVPNGVLPVGPALHDVRAEAVVVLFPSGTVTGAQVDEEGRRRSGRADIRLAGLRLSPPVSVVAPGTTLTIHNEDRLPHTLLCSSAAAAIPRQSVPAGGRATVTLQKAGEYLLLSEEFAHLSGAVLVVERGFYGRVEPSGAFQFEAPEGHYQAKLFWRGAWVAAEPVDLAEQGIDLRLKATVPTPAAPKAPAADAARPAGQSS